MPFNDNYNNYTANNSGGINTSPWANSEEFERAASACLARVFMRMFAALLVTAATALAVVSSQTLMELIFDRSYSFIFLLIIQFALVFAISAGINKMSYTAASILFFTFAVINGLTLSVIFLVYDLGIIYQAFAVSALMFAAMAIYGTITRRDLSTVGSVCIMGLFGIIIASVTNLLFRNDMMDAIISYVGVVVFVGLTAYDTQRIKLRLREAGAYGQNEAIQGISIIGALMLYLNFINLFLKILRILARRR